MVDGHGYVMFCFVFVIVYFLLNPYVSYYGVSYLNV